MGIGTPEAAGGGAATGESFDEPRRHAYDAQPRRETAPRVRRTRDAAAPDSGETNALGRQIKEAVENFLDLQQRVQERQSLEVQQRANGQLSASTATVSYSTRAG